MEPDPLRLLHTSSKSLNCFELNLRNNSYACPGFHPFSIMDLNFVGFML